MNRRKFFPLFITCLTVFFFLLVAGGCGGDGDRTKATSATTNAEKMAQVFHGEVVHLPLKRSSESDLEKFLSEVFVLQRSNDRLVPVKTGEKATIRDRMFPFKNGETPKVFNPQESQRTTALLRKMQTKAIDVSAFVSGRFSEDIMNSNVPLRNVEHAMEMSITAGTGSEKNKKSTSNFQSQSESDCEINFPSSTDDLGTISVVKMQSERRYSIVIKNLGNCTATRVTHDIPQQTIPGIQILIEDPENGTAMPPQSSKTFKLILRPYAANEIVHGNYTFKIYWMIYTSGGLGGSSTQTVHLNIMDTLYNLEFFERSGKGIIVGQTEGLIGGKVQAGYVNDHGDLLTENLTAQIPFSYRKTGLTPDGNTRLMMRITSYLDNYVPAQRFAIAFPYVENLGFRIEQLDGTLVTDGRYYGYVPAVDNGNGKYQATVVLIPPNDYGPQFSWPIQNLVLSVQHQSELSDNPGEYRSLDWGDHQFTIVPNPLVTIGGLWGNRTGVFGNLHGEYYNWGLLDAVYGYSHPWSIRSFLSWDGKGDLTKWSADGVRLSSLLDKRIFASYNDAGWACTQADFLAYSMGGIFIWNYVNNSPEYLSPSNYGNGRVHKLVSLGTPYLGTNVANFVLGDASYFYSDPNANPLTKAFCEYRRPTLIALHLIMKAYNSWSNIQSFIDRSEALEFYDGFFNFDDENIIGSIKTARYGGMPMRSLHMASPANLQMYGFYADVTNELQRMMDLNPKSIPTIGGAVELIESLRGSEFPYQRVGDIPLGLDLFTDLKKFLMGENESLFSDDTTEMIDSLVKTSVQYVPQTAKMDDLLVFLQMLFGGGHDTTTPIDSGKWFFEQQNRYLFEDYFHQELPVSLTMAEIFFNNLLRTFDSTPDMVFKKFDGTPLDYDGKIGLPRNFVMPTSDATTSTQFSSSVPTLVSGNGWVRLPEETESLEMRLSHSQDVVPGQVIGVWGTVPPGTPDDVYVHIYIIGVDNGTYTSKTTVTVGEEYRHYFAFKKPGVYQIQARLHSSFEAASQDVSPKEILVIMPPVTTITGLSFHRPFFLNYGEEVVIEGLIVTDEETGRWDVSDPLFGVVYSVEDPSLVQLEGKRLKAIGEGTTTLHATFRGYTASTQIQIER